MKHCRRCDIEIKDGSVTCPLCDSVLEGKEQGEPAYPEIGYQMQRFLFIKRLFYFSLLVVGVTSVLVNYYTFHRFHEIYWSVIVLGAIGYCWFTVSYTVMNHTNLGAKVIFQAVGILLVTVIADYVTGYRGWSLRFVIPGMLLLADIALLALMLLWPERWQGFFMCQIAVCVLGVVPVGIAYLGWIDNMFLAILDCVILWLSLAGTIIFGGRRTRLELKRRFHT